MNDQNFIHNLSTNAYFMYEIIIFSFRYIFTTSKYSHQKITHFHIFSDLL